MDGCQRVRREADYWTKGSRKRRKRRERRDTGNRDLDEELTFLQEGRQSRRRAEAGSTILSDCKGEEGSLLALPPRRSLSSEAITGGTIRWRQNWAWQAESMCDSQRHPASVRRARVCRRDRHLSGAGAARGAPLPHVPSAAAAAPEIPGQAEPAGPGTHFEDR